MGSWLCKNTFNNVTSKMVPPEPSGFTKPRHAYPNTDKAEENDLKDYLFKMIEVLKKEMKYSLKEIK